MQRERLIPCPSDNEECKYYPDCHLSEHHIYPRRTADTPLKKKFGNMAINKVVCCRNIHDLLDTFPPPSYPSTERMRNKLYGGSHG